MRACDAETDPRLRERAKDTYHACATKLRLMQIQEDIVNNSYVKEALAATPQTLHKFRWSAASPKEIKDELITEVWREAKKAGSGAELKKKLSAYSLLWLRLLNAAGESAQIESAQSRSTVRGLWDKYIHGLIGTFESKLRVFEEDVFNNPRHDLACKPNAPLRLARHTARDSSASWPAQRTLF